MPVEVRQLVPGDEHRLSDFLETRADSSMFLRSNLRVGGLVDQGPHARGQLGAQPLGPLHGHHAHLGVAGRELLAGEQRLHRRGEVEQAHGVGDGGAVFADALGDVFLAQVELAGEAHEGLRFLDRVEVLALQVLDERHLQDIAVALDLDDAHRDLLEPELDGRAPAAFAGDELQLAPDLAHDERLDNPVLADRIDQLLELLGLELLARLERAGDDGLQRRERVRPVGRGFTFPSSTGFSDEGSEPFS